MVLGKDAKKNLSSYPLQEFVEAREKTEHLKREVGQAKGGNSTGGLSVPSFKARFFA